jgi:hypothetical protein
MGSKASNKGLDPNPDVASWGADTNMLCSGSLTDGYPIPDRHDGGMYLEFTIGFYDNKDNT